MKPPPFEYQAPRTLEEALSVLAEAGDDAKVLAGGQSLIPLLNLRFASPSVLIDLNNLGELARIVPDGGETRFGALVRHSQLERDPQVTERHPLLAEAVRHVAHPQIRNRGTMGGTTAHADPAAEIPVVLLMSEARVRASSTRGIREIAAEDFFVSIYTTSLEPDEIITEVIVPDLAVGAGRTAGQSFQEFARRHGDYAIGGAGAIVVLDADGVCRSARVGLLGAGLVPVLAAEAAAVVVGQRIDEALAREAAAAATADITPMGNVHGDPEYRREVIREMTYRVLIDAKDKAGASAV